MNIFFYTIIFIIGTLFGSFYTLAVYRIPKRQDITHTHSYCPNCNHKLGFLDLIPIFSYLFLGAKCRYCKEKIRPRYFILEILSGFLFVSVAYLMKLDIYELSIYRIAEYSFMALYITFIILLCGIDKENRNISKGINVYGVVISILYMVYLWIIENASIYRYGIYLILYIIILTLDTITLKKYAKNSYITGLMLMAVTMAVFTGYYVTTNAIIVTIISIAIVVLLNKIKNWKNKSKKVDKQIMKEITIGYCLGLSNMIILLLTLFFVNYIK